MNKLFFYIVFLASLVNLASVFAFLDGESMVINAIKIISLMMPYVIYLLGYTKGYVRKDNYDE